MTGSNRGTGASISAQLRNLAAAGLQPMGLELVHLTYRREGKQWVLRLMIDREGGVSMQDCADASNQVGAVLEVEDLIPHSYVLEVTSPGLDRPLFTAADYRRFAGHEARIRTHRPVDGRRQFDGTLVDCRDDDVILSLPEGGTVSLPLESIADGRLQVDLDKELSRSGPAGRAAGEAGTGKRKVQE